MGITQAPSIVRQPSTSEGRGSAWYPGLTTPSARPLRRRVLIVEEIPSVSNILHALLNVLNCDTELAIGREQALAMIAREEFDAVLLDLRHADLTSKTFISQVRKIRPDVVSHILVITGEVEEATTARGTRRHLPCATDVLLMENIHRRLLALWGLSQSS